MTTTAPPRPATAPAPAPVSAPPHSPRPGTGTRAGVAAGLAAYLLWGFIPLFFKKLAHVPPIVVLSHRILWSAAFVALVLTVQRQWPQVLAVLRRRKAMQGLAASTVMIAINWFVFLWAVTNNQVVQAGLGYFINPLVNVLLGIVFLRERLRLGQGAALLLATAGVAVLVVVGGTFPWVALSLAWSFAFYALLRKTVPAGPLVGLFVETVLLLPLAVFFVARFSASGTQLSSTTSGLLAASGVITAVPLILFATAARRLTMATMGFLQFLSPTCQLLLAVFAFKEPFTRWHALSFGLIWVALLLYCVESFRAYRDAREDLALAEG